MKKTVGIALLAFGILLTGLSASQLFRDHASQQEALAIAETLIAARGSSPTADPNAAESGIPAGSQPETTADPAAEAVIGLLQIPALDETYPIIEGTEEQMLARGVGHYPTTALPGGNEQILLSGHRGTVFQRLGELQPGDRFIIEMGYGRYEYAMHRATIVAADDTTIIAPQGEEVLTLSTCYPFGYLGSAPDRYIIYAYPIAASNDQLPQPAS
nr:class D sortase [uncultured Trichococcus sp.]